MTTTIGGRVKAQRSAMGLSQSELGRRAGLTSAAIWQVEHGARTPSAATLCKLADALHVSTDWLLCRTHRMAGPATTDDLTADEIVVLTKIADAFRARRAVQA